MDEFGVPFEAQTEPRGCGAACLAMVYSALRRPVPQAEIWPLVAHRNAFGSLASTTHLMAADAGKRGFEAVAVQARDPLSLLRACSDAGLHGILHTRHSRDDRSGHYMLLLDIDSTYVRLHDPNAGPGRLLSHQELLALWQPLPGASEVTGNLLIAISAPGAGADTCPLCRTAIPQSIDCPRCHAPVALRPPAALGCVSATCEKRLWDRICCPECDLLWGAAPAADAPLPPPARGPDPAAMFAALDKFQTVTNAIPGMASSPEIGQLIGALAGLRAQLQASLAADITARAAVAAQQKALADSIAARAPPAPVPAPGAPPDPVVVTVDAKELGRALLLRLAN